MLRLKRENSWPRPTWPRRCMRHAAKSCETFARSLLKPTDASPSGDSYVVLSWVVCCKTQQEKRSQPKGNPEVCVRASWIYVGETARLLGNFQKSLTQRAQVSMSM